MLAPLEVAGLYQINLLIPVLPASQAPIPLTMVQIEVDLQEIRLEQFPACLLRFHPPARIWHTLVSAIANPSRFAARFTKLRVQRRTYLVATLTLCRDVAEWRTWRRLQTTPAAAGVRLLGAAWESAGR